MGLQIIGNQFQITSAINSFNPSYHADYFGVRCLAKTYLLGKTPSLITANPLAVALHDVLGRWGAALRKAPTRRSVADISKALMNPRLHGYLNKFANVKLTDLALNNKGIREINATGEFATLAQFDDGLLETLNTLAAGLFINNTNVTYPMKALLLITGFMPAFDGQVRKGLKRAGFSGVEKTRFLLPQNTFNADGKKICALPFYMSDCFHQYNGIIQRAITASNYSALTGEIGRVFDVLLFVQQGRGQKTLALQPPNNNWYMI